VIKSHNGQIRYGDNNLEKIHSTKHILKGFFKKLLKNYVHLFDGVVALEKIIFRKVDFQKGFSTLKCELLLHESTH
jgi:hypothetical protein